MFAGGFDLDAAEAVAAGDDLAQDAVLPSLESLGEQALVRTVSDRDADRVRYGMLEPIRQYATEKLAASREGGRARARHTAWCLTPAEQAEQAERELSGPEQIPVAGRPRHRARQHQGRSGRGTWAPGRRRPYCGSRWR